MSDNDEYTEMHQSLRTAAISCQIVGICVCAAICILTLTLLVITCKNKTFSGLPFVVRLCIVGYAITTPLTLAMLIVLII